MACQVGQRGTGAFGFLCWYVGLQDKILLVLYLVLLCLYFFVQLYYKNVSLVIAKRLLREPNVVMLLVFGLCNWVIHIARPHNAFSPILGLIYMLVVSAFVFLDAVKTKSRVFVIAVGILFVLINVNNIYHLIFGDSESGRRVIGIYDTREQIYLHETVHQTVYIHTSSVIQYGRYLYPI